VKSFEVSSCNEVSSPSSEQARHTESRHKNEMAKTFLDFGRFTLNPAIVEDSYGKVRRVSREINEPTSALKLFCGRTRFREQSVRRSRKDAGPEHLPRKLPVDSFTRMTRRRPQLGKWVKVLTIISFKTQCERRRGTGPRSEQDEAPQVQLKTRTTSRFLRH